MRKYVTICAISRDICPSKKLGLSNLPYSEVYQNSEQKSDDRNRTPDEAGHTQDEIGQDVLSGLMKKQCAKFDICANQMKLNHDHNDYVAKVDMKYTFVV